LLPSGFKGTLVLSFTVKLTKRRSQAESMVTNFKPSVNGLHFANYWLHEPDIVVPVPPFGNVTIGDANNGLCGGMVFTALDVFLAMLPPIPDTTNPPQGSPLFNYIVSRLFASFNLPGGVLKYLDWMRTPDHDTGFSFLGNWIVTQRGVAWHTIEEELPKIKADIDSGSPSPLALVTIESLNPADLGQNHQVLAYAYEQDNSGNVTIHVYDPNTDPPHADGVQLSLNINNPTHTTPITHNVNIVHPIRGFFHVDYTFSNPASLEPVTPLPSNAYFVNQSVQSPLIPGQASNVSVTMQNIGGTTWTSQGTNPFRLGSQNPQDNTTWGLVRVDVPSNVTPGNEITFNFTITAPSAPGTYNFQWRMVEELVTWFGDTTPNVPVVVQAVLRQMIVYVQPFPVPVGRSVVLTVFAQDAQTHAPLSGSVTFNGLVVASTNTPFNYTLPIKRVLDPETKQWTAEPNPPNGVVTAPGYATAHIDFGV
jgi:hypothetical protein